MKCISKIKNILSHSNRKKIKNNIKKGKITKTKKL